MLNTIALSTDRPQALTIAERARKTVAEWPQSHYGYRQKDIREIVSLLDAAISSLRAVGGGNPFELQLVALADPPELEPVRGMPNVKEQLDQMMRLASITKPPSERMAVLQGALGLVAEAAPSLPAAEASSYRTEVERAIRNELDVDRQYTICRAGCWIKRLARRSVPMVRQSNASSRESRRKTRSWDRSARRWWRR